jgi:hypothetical protein
VVTFLRIPYAEAARRARRQDRIVYASLIATALSVLSYYDYDRSRCFVSSSTKAMDARICLLVAADCQRRFVRVR